MRILVTGSRDFTHPAFIAAAIEEVLEEFDAGPRSGEKVAVVHGDCPKGADRIAGRVAHELGLAVEPHAADWKVGKQAGHWRNQHMVDLGADICLAFHVGAINPRSGTSDCVRRAREAGIPVREVVA